MDYLQYLNETFKSEITAVVKSHLPLFSPPFVTYLETFRDGTFVYLENLIYTWKVQNPNAIAKESINLVGWKRETLSFIEMSKKVDVRYRSFMESMNRLLLDNTVLLRKDKDLHTLLSEHIEAEKNHFMTYHLLAPLPYSGRSIGTARTPADYPSRIRFDFFESYIKRIDELEKSVRSVIEQTVAVIKEQESFIQRQVHSPNVPTDSPGNFPAPVQPAMPGLPEILPAYSPDEMDIIQTLRNKREQLLRTLQSEPA